jgi:ectoine hydroxylase-related dioxygenase (phytanoyl-CoA dioxygenase family)
VLDRERDIYERDGVVCLRQVFSEKWLTVLSDAVEKLMAAPDALAEEYTPRGKRGRFFGDIEMALRIEAFGRFVHDSPAAEIAGRIMGATRVNFFYDQLLVKEPGTQERTPWHQDQPYWAVSGYQICSVWLPLDAVPIDVCPEYVCGSHRWSEFSPYHFADGTPYKDTGLPPMPDIESHREQYPIIQFALEPGDCLVFQAMIVHAAPGNPHAERRRALSTRWTGDDARYCVRPGEVAIPTEDPGLKHGDPLDSPRFPVVWRK